MKDKNYEVKNGWLICEINCENTALRDIGVPTDMWIKYAFKISKIIGIKELNEDETVSLKDKCGIIVKAEIYCVNMTFDEVFEVLNPAYKA